MTETFDYDVLVRAKRVPNQHGGASSDGPAWPPSGASVAVRFPRRSPCIYICCA